MHELYYSPGACSFAVRFALDQAELPHRLNLVAAFRGEHLRQEYRDLNPLSLIPTMRAPEGELLTEVCAILTYLASLRPDHDLLPTETMPLARAHEWMSLFASSVHPAFVSYYNPVRVTKNEAIHPALKESGRENFHRLLRFVDSRLPADGYVLGGRRSALDGYAFVFFMWGMRMKLPVLDLHRYARLARTVASHPAGERILRHEGLDEVLLGLGVGSAAASPTGLAAS